MNSATLNTESSSRPGNRPDRAGVPVVGVNTVDRNALAIRRDTQTEMRSGILESSAKGKRVKFGLSKSGEKQIESERAETGVHQSPMKSQLRNKN